MSHSAQIIEENSSYAGLLGLQCRCGHQTPLIPNLFSMFVNGSAKMQSSEVYFIHLLSFSGISPKKKPFIDFQENEFLVKMVRFICRKGFGFGSKKSGL